MTFTCNSTNAKYSVYISNDPKDKMQTCNGNKHDFFPNFITVTSEDVRCSMQNVK